ncbi:MAG: InlB B-repeat-containing protein [Alphaproteobacteria bacterium]|nr:InlB B-repeat-containing protein [Alphaproteobacteria bacterium]
MNNTLNISWNPDNGTTPIQNMCMYDGAIEVPADPVKPGYTFTGWKLVE